MKNLQILANRYSTLTCQRSSLTNQLRNKGLVRLTATEASETITPRTQKIVGKWLLGCAGMCMGAICIGGITRLTESGLSMTDWHPVKGGLPWGEKAWEEEFERYKQFPEYKYLERELTLSDFKYIFFWEYFHRMWGRTIGLVYALPALYFLKKGWVTRAMKPRLGIYGGLILFQGLLGWYMVKSGLEDKPESTDIPRVSQYRLAAHLSSAMVLFTLFLWQGLAHVLPPQKLPNTVAVAKLGKYSHGLMAMIFFTAVSGAFVAGMDAGLVYNTWPKMADKWIPDDLWAISPKWKNIFENPTTAQFDHRLLGELTGVAVIAMWYKCRKAGLPPRAMLAANCLAGMAMLQVSLGIATLLTFVPVWLAATHQSGATTLLGISIWLARELKRFPK